MKNKILSFVISIIAFLGLNVTYSNATISKSVENQIKNITEDTPLYLEHYSKFLDSDSFKYSWHYSHQSHESHRSHYSHQSHESHYSHYSSY